MKSSNIDNSYSLDCVDNYRPQLEQDVNEIVNKYVELIKEYLNFINDNIKIRNKQYIKFIIKRGLDTITNVFLNILYYTKNLNLTYFHCQKSFYFYVEFIGQITEDQHVYLQLSSRDAATYVYRKTIFELNNEYRKNINAPSKETINKIDLLNVYIEIYKLLASKLVNPIKIYDENNSAEIKKDDKNNLIINENLIKINSKLRVFTFNLNELKNLNLLIEILDTKIEDENRFLEILINYLKKIYKNSNLILKINEKMKNEDLHIYLDENVDKLVNWLIN
jgi:hypothetical protein